MMKFFIFSEFIVISRNLKPKIALATKYFIKLSKINDLVKDKIKKGVISTPFFMPGIHYIRLLKTIIYFHSLHQSQYPGYLISFVPIDIFDRS